MAANILCELYFKYRRIFENNNKKIFMVCVLKDEFWMEPYKAESAQSHTVLMSGAGTTKRRKSEATTAIYLNVSIRYIH